MGNVYVVSPPRFQGRPEQYIMEGFIKKIKGSQLVNGWGPASHISVSTFYDHEVWVRHQMEVIAQLLALPVTSEDHVLFGDFWFPGLEMLRLVWDQRGINPTKIAFVHGGSFVPGDQFEDEAWAKYLEKSWMWQYDRIWVQTEYTAECVRAFAPVHVGAEHIRIVGSPFNPSDYLKNRVTNPAEKKFDVVFPHRFTEDKGFEDFKIIASYLAQAGMKILALTMALPSQETMKSLDRIGVSVVVGCDDQAFQHHVASARVALSTAKQELFGYSMLQATALGCIPLVPDRACYPRLYPARYRYNCVETALKMATDFCQFYPGHTYIPDSGFQGGKLVNGELI